MTCGSSSAFKLLLRGLRSADFLLQRCCIPQRIDNGIQAVALLLFCSDFIVPLLQLREPGGYCLQPILFFMELLFIRRAGRCQFPKLRNLYGERRGPLCFFNFLF